MQMRSTGTSGVQLIKHRKKKGKLLFTPHPVLLKRPRLCGASERFCQVQVHSFHALLKKPMYTILVSAVRDISCMSVGNHIISHNLETFLCFLPT